MTRKRSRNRDVPEAPFARFIAGAKTEDQQLRALEVAARVEVALPAEAFVVGEPVIATEVAYGGHPRAGLTLRCERGARRFSVGLADVAFPPGSPGARFVAAYRAWLGLGELEPAEHVAGPIPAARPKAETTDLVVGEPVELVVLACKRNALRCRVLGTSREVTLRAAVRDEVPGAIITLTLTRQWMHARHPYVSGDIAGMRFDVVALGLSPLALLAQGEWDPEDECWGEPDDPIEAWAKPIIARGKRPMFEMEQVVPGVAPGDFDSDPILEAAELRSAGDWRGAYELLLNLLAKDLRCLDAHAHLGNLEFERTSPRQALAHYEFGMSVGALSLGKDFGGVLSWGHLDNRPFLHCMHGAGLCAWRLGDVRTAKALFKKMLWLNPGDNQGARFNVAAIEAGKTWEEMEGTEG